MELTIKNIGIVKESRIKLDGLTVITGKNNSGKTTVGRVVYSLFDSVTDIKDKVRIDKINFIIKKINKTENKLTVLKLLKQPENFDDDGIDMPNSKKCIQKLFNNRYMDDLLNIEKYLIELNSELKSFDTKKFEKELETWEFEKFIMSRTNKNDIVSVILEDEIIAATAELDNVISILRSDDELIDYTRENIYRTLLEEFNEEILPINRDVEYGSIKIADADSIYFNMKLTNSSIIDNGQPIFYKTPYTHVFFIDNPFVLEESPRFYQGFNDLENYSVSFFNRKRIRSHGENLRRAILDSRRASVLEYLNPDNSLLAIKQLVSKIIPGEFEFTREGKFYIVNDHKINIKNLATGSKMFSLLKLLIDKDKVDMNTIIILDEPEAHLHPEWQNSFAEIIVLLVKEVGVNILLTSHSPNFVLAIEAYMRKYEIIKKTNFYQTDVQDNGTVEYKCVNEDLGEIYTDFMESFSYAKEVRDNYYYGLDEDDSDV